MGQLEPASGVPVNQSEAGDHAESLSLVLDQDLAADQGRRRIQRNGMVFEVLY